MNLRSFTIGTAATIAIAFIAKWLVQFHYLSILGTMVTAILLGIALRAAADKLAVQGQQGISFTAKYVLRAGIILMGIRLNIADILAAGWPVILLDITVICFAVWVITTLGKRFRMEQDLTALLAVGTGVCGAAAIGAVAPLIKAKEEDVAVSVTVIAILGTVFTIAYIAFLPWLALDPHHYGLFAGSTLHELAHVIAASAPGGNDSSTTAILVKLGRVAFLAPVALFFGWLHERGTAQEVRLKQLPIPWFIFGFLGMALINTYAALPAQITSFITDFSVFLLTMAMAAMGLNVRYAQLKRVGLKPFAIGLCGSLLLSIYGRIAISVLMP